MCKNLSCNTGYEITLKNPSSRLSVIPAYRFKADKITVKSKTDGFSAEISNCETKIRLLPLLSGKLHLNTLDIGDLTVNAEIKDNMELDKDFFEKLKNTRFFCNILNLESFKVILSQKNVNEPIIYSGKDLHFRKNNRYISLNLISELMLNGQKSAANVELYLPKNNDISRTVFDIDIANLNIAPFKVYFRHYLPKNLKELRGYINVSADRGEITAELKNCAIIMEDSAESIILPQKTNIKSKFNITQKYINFINADVKANGIDLSLSGKICDYLGKTMPTTDLNIIINKSRLENIISCLPPFIVEEINVYKLKKYKFYGDIIGNLTLKGRLPEPDINGEVFVNNGILIRPIPDTTAGATVKLKFSGKYVNFEVLVPAGGAEKVWVNGSQELYNVKYADMRITSTQRVNLQSAEQVVNPLHEILNFIIGPVPIIDVHGTGNIDITVKGNRKKPHVWGGLNFRNASVKFNEIPDLMLTNADAVLTFNDQNAVFISKNGLVNGQTFEITGTCDLNGKFDFDVQTKKQPLNHLYKAITTATLIPDIKKMITVLDSVNGLADLNIRVFGAVKVIEELKFGENVFAKGNISLNNGEFAFKNIRVSKANGNIKFDKNDAEAEINAGMSGSQLSLKAKVKNQTCDGSFNIPRFNPNYLIPDEELRNREFLPEISITAKYRGDINNIEYDKINANISVFNSPSKSNIKFNSGEINVLNNKVIVKGLRGYIDNPKHPFKADLKLDDAFGSNPEINGMAEICIPDLTLLNHIFVSSVLPEKYSRILKDYEFKEGALKLAAKFSGGKISADTNPENIAILYLPQELPVKILNGGITLRSNNLKLNKINILADKMPLLADGEIRDIFNKKYFDIYLSSKPQQEFIDKYINKNVIYPLKIKGDIVYWAKIKGIPEDYNLKTNVDINKDSGVYYLGATVGDLENAINLSLDSNFSGNNVRIKEFSYDKLIDSQSGKQTRLNMLKTRGRLELSDNDVVFKDLQIKTAQPTDARIFNILFRKPNIKQGQFTSDLKLNGKMSCPHFIGDFHIFETNIPFMDTTMKNIELIFKDRTIDISSKGEVMGNVVHFKGTMRNKLSPPYHVENALLYTKDLDLNTVVNKLKSVQADEHTSFESFEGFDWNSVVLNNFKLKADKIELRNIKAENFQAVTSLSEKRIFDVNSFDFNIAKGTLHGKYRYNLNNNDILLNLTAENINANDITYALFDLDNQIYGDLTGSVNLSCNGNSFRKCMESLNGNTLFNVKDGRMPKLGSLEYLLKAGNLVKGGITSLSINSVIDLITPLKTGDFSDIYGSISIKDGVAKNIEISTKGRDLNLFISGTYNFATSVAEMEVLGLLSRKISTMFGPIGNLSLNTLFNVIPGIDLGKDSPMLERINRIPGLEISDKTYRKFIAIIKGNINGEDYVTSFKWIN